MNRRNAIKIAIVVVIGAVAATLYIFRDHFSMAEIRVMVDQLRGVWYAPIVMIAAYAVGCVFAVPASFFILSSGVIWGWKLGGTYAMVGGVLGATASFLVGRFVGEGMLTKFGKVGRAVEKNVEHAGFRSLLVLRLIPLFPFAVLNYGAGVARVAVLDFIFATAFGLAPSNYVFAYSADSIFNGSLSQADAFRRVLIVAALVLAVVLIPMFFKKKVAAR